MASTTNGKEGHIRLLSAGMSERPNGEIIAQGFLDIPSMLALKVDDYQRENLTNSNKGWGKSSLRNAIKQGATLPSIVLGMRGQRWRQERDDMVLECPTFIVDGLQRISALLRHADENPDTANELRIGAEVRFDTNHMTEKDLFEILNTRRVPVSPNIILRNMKDINRAVLTLYGLTKSDTSSVLYGRVQWQQRMGRGEMFTAAIFAKSMSVLHAPPGGSFTGGASRITNVAEMLQKRQESVGLKNFRENVSDFFNLMDECWGIRNVAYSKMATHLRGNFINTLAALFSGHRNFWSEDDKRLSFTPQDKKKLAAFPINDPEIARLASAGNSAMPILRNLMEEHYNKGKKINRLVKRRKVKDE